MGLDQVELIMALEDAFEIDFTDEEAEKIVTVGDLYTSICRKIEAANDDRDRVWERLVDVFVLQTGIDRSEVRKDARIVADLGID